VNVGDRTTTLERAGRCATKSRRRERICAERGASFYRKRKMPIDDERQWFCRTGRQITDRGRHGRQSGLKDGVQELLQRLQEGDIAIATGRTIQVSRGGREMHWRKQADEEFVRGASGMKRTNGCSRNQSVTVTGESFCWRTSFFAAFLIRLGTPPVCTRIWSQPLLHTLWPRWLSEHLDNSLDVCYYGLPRPDGPFHPCTWGPNGYLSQTRSVLGFLWSRLLNRLHYPHRNVLLLPPRFPRRPRRLCNHRFCCPQLDRQDIDPQRHRRWIGELEGHRDDYQHR
jgi:hypothetical protein